LFVARGFELLVVLPQNVELFRVVVLRKQDRALLRSGGRSEGERQYQAKPRDKRGAQIELARSPEANHRFNDTPAGPNDKLIIGNLLTWIATKSGYDAGSR
jgi:hypothetical protein